MCHLETLGILKCLSVWHNSLNFSPFCSRSLLPRNYSSASTLSCPEARKWIIYLSSGMDWKRKTFPAIYSPSTQNQIPLKRFTNGSFWGKTNGATFACFDFDIIHLSGVSLNTARERRASVGCPGASDYVDLLVFALNLLLYPVRALRT